MHHKNRLTGVVLATLFLQTFIYSQEVTRTSSPDESAIRVVLDQYFDAYAREDLEGCMRLWSANSPNVTSRKEALDNLFKANDNLKVTNVAIRKFTPDGERANVRVVLEASAVDVKSKKPADGFGKLNRELQLVKENGAWKIWRDVAAEEELATKLVAAKSQEERDALTAAEKELITADLWKALTAQAARQFNLSNYPQALTINQLSLAIAEQIGDREGIGQALSDIGSVKYFQSNYVEALDYLHKSLKLRKEGGNKQKLGRTLNNLAAVYSSQGNYSLASEYFQKALEQLEAVGDTLGMGATLMLSGNMYLAQGSHSLAMKNYERAREHFEAVGHKVGQAMTLNNIGIIYNRQGNYPQALDYYQRSLKLKEATGNKSGIAASLQNIGDCYRAQGKYDLALDHLQQSLAQFEALGETTGRASTMGTIALVHYLKGDYTKALELAERATTIGSPVRSRELLWEIHTTAGRAYRALNQPERASQAFQEAIADIEGLREWAAGGDQLQQRFFENKISPYHEMIALLVDQGKPDEALAYAEQAKARVLLDVLRRGKVDVTKAMTAKEREQETKLKSELILLNTQASRERQRAQPDQTQLANLEVQLNKARLEYEGFQSSLYAAHPELKARRGEVRSVTLAEAATLLPGPDTALLEYVVTENNTYLFVLTKDAGVLSWKAHKVVIKRKELADQVENFRQQLAKRDLTFKEFAGKLYDLLLKPAERQLNGKRSLVIVPDGPLWELPFQALQNTPQRYLVEDHAISYAPSLTVLREMSKLRTKAAESPTLLAFGNPALPAKEGQSVAPVEIQYRDELMPLPEAEREVKSLARLYGASRSKVYTGPAAREELLKVEAGRHRVLQLAAHALLNDESPMYSHVLLAQGAGDAKDDGLLEVWEMMNLDLNADLVVLSACETGRGKVAAGEGVIGMSWALFVAGSPTTVVSLWKVESLSTTELMLEFHRNLLSSVSKAQALQRAAIKMLRTRQYRHPFYWAGFSIVGRR